MSVALKKLPEVPQLDTKRWNKRVLVVEDEVGILDSYKEILAESSKVVPIVRSSRSQKSQEQSQSFDFQLELSHRALKGLELVKKAKEEGNPFAMAFLDVKLGAGMDGIELAKEILEIDPEMYIVFVTAYNDRSIDSIHSTLGPDKVDKWDYLNKPFHESEIIQKARNYVSMWNLKKEMEARVLEISEMQKRLYDSERFSSVAAVARGVTHEFGNILLQIMGKADIVRNKSEEDMRQGIDKILSACQKASDILTRFNGLSNQVETSKKKERVSVNQVLEDALDLMEHQIRVSNTKVNILKSDAVSVLGHETSLMQVFVNLTLNAIFEMKDKKQLDYTIEDSGNNVILKIRDYGPGIPEDKLEKVLEPFFTTKGEKGTGLGLAICREIIEIEMKGEFKLNNLNDGLEIEMKIPRYGGKDA